MGIVLSRATVGNRSNRFPPRRLAVKKLILRSFQSPGDVLMLTAAVRDLHRAHPGQFQTDMRTSADALWENNPNLTRLREGEPGVNLLDMHYPLIDQSSQRPYHFIHGYVQYLEQQLRLPIPVTRFQGDVYLAEQEKLLPAGLADFGIRDGFWIVVAGGKYDFTYKWWSGYQKVVDHFRGVIQFVQCGEVGHWHPPLDGVINLIGKTSTREFIRLMYHADGVLCPVTFAMHLAAAVPPPPTAIGARACVVIAGGRESPHWEAYPQHQFLHTVGALRCCAQGGCWKSRCQLVGDGDGKDRQNVCEQPVQITPDLRIPRCMEMITPDNVIRGIALYLDGGAIPPAPHVNGSARRLPVETPATKAPTAIVADAASVGTERLPTQAAPATTAVADAASVGTERPPTQAAPATTNALLKFPHGLGDAVQLTTVLQHLRRHHPDWNINVAALVGKHSAFHGLCRQVYVLDREPPRGATTASSTWNGTSAIAASPTAPAPRPSAACRESFASRRGPSCVPTRFSAATRPTTWPAPTWNASATAHRRPMRAFRQC